MACRRLGNAGGVRFDVHASALVAVVVLTSVLALGLLPVTAPDQPVALYWLGGLVVALGFFASVVLHELAHAVAARRYGVSTHRVVLGLPGGTAEREAPPPSPRADVVIAVAGPVASAGAGLGCWGLALTVEPLLSPTALAVLLWLGLANLVFCVFTLLPGAPLDGGRLVRAAVWSRTRDRERAERVARRCGSALGATLMACGAAAVILFGQFVAIWLAVAGWLLLSARAVGSTSGGEDTVTP
jgi:Zn-dependent protease